MKRVNHKIAFPELNIIKIVCEITRYLMIVSTIPSRNALKYIDLKWCKCNTINIKNIARV